MIVQRLTELGGSMTEGPVTLEGAIDAYLDQIEALPGLREKLRFNYLVMSSLERPVAITVMLEASDPKTREMFETILANENRILGWCDETATAMGCPELDVDLYFGAARGG